eukprot:360194-Chlamydomonas_euryale.AAC.17
MAVCKAVHALLFLGPMGGWAPLVKRRIQACAEACGCVISLQSWHMARRMGRTEKTDYGQKKGARARQRNDMDKPDE